MKQKKTPTSKQARYAKRAMSANGRLTEVRGGAVPVASWLAKRWIAVRTSGSEAAKSGSPIPDAIAGAKRRSNGVIPLLVWLDI